MAVGSAIFVFVVSVCMYMVHRTRLVLQECLQSAVAFTINAVGQDKFEDVIVPDTPQQPPKTPKVAVNGSK
jgi:hypothetical protein